MEGSAIVRTSSMDAAGARAIILTSVFSLTDFVVTANVADVSPAGIVTTSGNLTFAESEVRFTLTPSLGAAPFILSVPVAVVPPSTLVGPIKKEVRMGGVNVRIAGTRSPMVYAEIVASSFDPTGIVVNEKEVAVEPAGTVTDSGPPQAVVVDGK